MSKCPFCNQIIETGEVVTALSLSISTSAVETPGGRGPSLIYSSSSIGRKDPEGNDITPHRQCLLDAVNFLTLNPILGPGMSPGRITAR